MPAAVPPADVAEEVLAAAQQAAPDSDLSLQFCTDWIADPGTLLESAAAQECAAMLAAAADTCRELDCFDATGTEETTTTTTVAPEPQPEPATVSATTEEAPTTDTTGTEETTTTTTVVAPEPQPEPTIEPEPDPDDVPEGGHPPLPEAQMVPRETPYWDYPTCTGSPPWPSTCYPPSEWEIPQDLSDCWTPDHDGGVCASRKPDETPRQTRDMVDWTNWCQQWKPISCEHLLSEMKWALDYLGVHPWCVVEQYNLRVPQLYRLAHESSHIPPDIRNGYGWHRCPTVIDPGQRDNPMIRIAESGISLAEQCRIVLPADVQLETTTRDITEAPERFGSDCDLWAAWVENRPGARHWRDCDRSARLAEEWMEHHYGVSEHYFPVTC